MQPATVIVKHAPMNVSSRAHFRSEKRRRLSATQLCWKKSCHGAIVVPTIAIIRKTRSDVMPPGQAAAWRCLLHGVQDVPALRRNIDPQPRHVEQAQEERRCASQRR